MDTNASSYYIGVVGTALMLVLTLIGWVRTRNTQPIYRQYFFSGLGLLVLFIGDISSSLAPPPGAALATWSFFSRYSSHAQGLKSLAIVIIGVAGVSGCADARRRDKAQAIESARRESVTEEIDDESWPPKPAAK